MVDNKKKHAIALIVSSLFFASAVLCLYEWNQYKRILFFDYDFGNAEHVHQNFFRLGFRYKANFAECAERRFILDNVEIFYNGSGFNYITLFYYSDRANSLIKAILNRKSHAREKEIYLPDDFYHSEPSEILEWTFEDRVIYYGRIRESKETLYRENRLS